MVDEQNHQLRWTTPDDKGYIVENGEWKGWEQGLKEAQKIEEAQAWSWEETSEKLVALK